MKHFPFFKLHSICKPIQQGLLLAFLLLVSSIQANATHTWTGASNNDWANTDNWSPASVPNGSDFVIIPNVANDPQIKDGTYAYVSGMEIKTDASLKIHGDGALFINGSIGDAILNKGTLNNGDYTHLHPKLQVIDNQRFAIMV
jgi:hypothetical protein